MFPFDDVIMFKQIADFPSWTDKSLCDLNIVTYSSIIFYVVDSCMTVMEMGDLARGPGSQ